MIAIDKAKIVATLAGAIKQDRANRYILTKDWTLPKLSIAVPDFENAAFLIRDSVITVKAYQSPDTCDGCTLSPDKIGKWNLVPSAIFHDPWYASIEEIADAWGWPRAAVRKIGDELFACIAVANGTPRWLARAYLTGIRAGGGIVKWFSAMKKAGVMLALLAAITLAAGCSGCAFPDYFNGSPVDKPQYEEPANGK